MSIVAILPILLLLTFIILSGFIFRTVKRLPRLSMNVSKGFILLYVFVLIGPVLIFVALPNKGETALSEQQIEVLYQENMKLEKAFQEKSIKNIDHMLVDSFTYEVLGKEVTLVSDMHTQTRVWIDWVDSQASVVEGTVYRTNYVYDNIKVEPNSVQINWNEDVLSIKHERKVERNIHLIKPALAIEELVNNEDKRYFSDTIYIHLKVPKHLEVIDESGLQF